MKMEKGENGAQYVARMKEVVSAIRSLGGQLEEETIISKYLRTFLPVYAIRVSTIQELRCVQGNTQTLEGIVGRLIAFELSNFDNYIPKNIEFSFKTKMTIKDTKESSSKKRRKVKHALSDRNVDEEDVE